MIALTKCPSRLSLGLVSVSDSVDELNMKKHYCLILTAAAAIAATPSSQAQTIVVETRAGGQNLTSYTEGLGNWQNSTLKSSAAGVTPGIGSRWSTAEGAIFNVAPPLEDGAIYAVDITQGSATSIALTMDVGITVVGGTGLPATTPVFGQNTGANTWEHIGFLTNDVGVTTPTITFTRMQSSGGRYYADAIRFTKFDPCFNGLPQLITVNGPLAAGQTFVNVPAVSGSATALNVYADGVKVGEKTSGITAGVNRVDLTGTLTKNAMVTVTQTDSNGIESCRPAVGTLVGGGANPSIRIALSIRQNTNELGPIGRNGGSTIPLIKFLGATGVVNNVNGNAPLGNRVFSPNTEWQTVEFLRGEDPANPTDGSYTWNGTLDANPNELKGNFGILDSIVFYIDEADSGPYAFYIDSFSNGGTLIQGFEEAAPGGSAGFLQPSFSGTTSPYLLSPAPGTISPNLSIVTNNTSDAGSHSLFTSFQFKDTNRINWVRFVAQGAGSPNPVVDLRLPISFRVLLLPVGQEPPPKAADITTGPADVQVIRGGTVTMRATYGGTSPFTFEWRRNGVPVPNATSATLTITDVQVSDAGEYTLVVSNGLGSDESDPATLTVDDLPFTAVMTPAWQLTNGSRTYIANDNSTRSIAYSPLTGNLLVASRSGQATNIYALNGNTGEFLYTLLPPPEGYVGGTFSLNQIAVAQDGTVYAGNLTEDGATTNFRLYRWPFGDLENEPSELIWEGNPANDPNINARWGDTMMVQGESGAHEVVISSRTGTMLAFIRPADGIAVTVDVTAAPANAFRLGLAPAPGDIIWGKTTGLPLLQVQMDALRTSGTILNSFGALNNMGPIGVNLDGTLLAGVFIDSPDHLRLYDISTPGSITLLDTEFFPHDNANGNATGAVAFGDNKVYALDSNNGLIAMNLDLSCLPDRATIERSGSDVIIRWSRATYTLEGADSIGGTWGPVSGASPVTLDASTGMRFFRLVCP